MNKSLPEEGEDKYCKLANNALQSHGPHSCPIQVTNLPNLSENPALLQPAKKLNHRYDSVIRALNHQGSELNVSFKLTTFCLREAKYVPSRIRQSFHSMRSDTVYTDNVEFNITLF